MKEPEFQRSYHTNGRPYQEVPFVEDQINGIIREWHRSGALAREVPMKDGLRHGICRQWNSRGQLLGAFEMKMGTGTSKQWHPNGQPQFEASVVSEKFNGRLRQWNEQGQLIAESFFVDNKRVPKAEYERAQRTNSGLPIYPEPDGNHPRLVKRDHRIAAAEQLARRLLSGRKAEAREWLNASTPAAKKTLGDLSTRKSASLVEEIYTVGAAEVFAADIDEDTRGHQTADKLVVTLPENARAREAIRELCAKKKLLFSPAQEIGESHLAILFA